MSKILNTLADFLEDMTTIEVAVITPDLGSETKNQVASYSRIEFEGDSINYIDEKVINQEKLLTSLHTQLIDTAVRSRKSMFNMAIMAINGKSIIH